MEGGPTNGVWYTATGEYWLAAALHAQWPARQAHGVAVYRPPSRVATPSGAGMAAWLRGVTGRRLLEAGRGMGAAPLGPLYTDEPSQLLVMGGTGSVGEYLNDVWATPDGLLWQQRATASWSARAAFATVSTSTAIYVLGGVGASGLLNDVWESTDGGNTWVYATLKAEWTPRYNFGAVAFDKQLYIMGGQTTQTSPTFASTQRLLQDVWRSEDGVHWTELVSPPWSARASFGLVAAGSSIWLFGGGMPATNDIWRTVNGTQWELVTAHAPWPPRAGLGADLISIKSPQEGPEVFAIVGGHEDMQHYFSDMWIASAEVLCLNAGESCSGHGACTTTHGCDCAFGWSGAYCNVAVCSTSQCINGHCEAATGHVSGEYCHCDDMWTGPRCDTPVCRKGCSPIHGSCPFGPNTCSCEAGWVGPDCTLPAGPDSVITLGEWVKQHARLLFEAVGGGCFFIVLVSAVYMNHWARRAAAGVKKQRRVHWAADVVTHDDRADRGGDDAGRASSRGRRVRPKWRGPARRPRAASPVPGQPAAAGAPDAEVKPVEGVEGSA